MRVKLRATGQTTVIPTPPPALQYGGVARPVRPSRRVYNGSVEANVEVAPAPINVGPYIPPPKPPVWVVIPVSIRPTRLREIIVTKRMP